MTSSNEVKAALEDLGKFTIQEEVDEGANAVAAFKAFDRLLHRDAFLKVIYYSADAAAELLHEPRLLVQATAGVPKPENLVQVLGADVLSLAGEQYLCLQMEWIEGASLLSSLTADAMGQFDALRLTRGILHGLAHLHSKRILHRDLKPANILLDGLIPKIADFGSAAVLPAGSTAVSASRHSALYVPPEGWAPEPSYSITSDIYQVGMVLYELVNGPLDYRLRYYLTPKVLRELAAAGKDFESLDNCDQSQQADRSIAELSSKGRLLLHGQPPRPYYSDRLRRIVNRATNPDPRKRFGSAEEFIARLNQVEVPNWRQLCGTEFTAENWRGWDWAVSSIGPRVVVKKAQPGSGKFRRIPNRTFPSLSDAFSHVEDQ